METQIKTLLDTCTALVGARDELKAHLEHCRLPFWLPPETDTPSYELAIAAATALYREDCPTPFRSGVLCIDDEAVKLVESVNQQKEALKAVIRSLKSDLPRGRDNRTFYKLLTESDSPLYQRDPVVANALRQIRFSDLPLGLAYRRFRVISATVHAIRWCWHTRRREVIRLTRKQAEALVERRLTDQLQEEALVALSNSNGHHAFARVRTQPSPQLKANVLRTIDDITVRTLITTPGIVMVNQPTLPALYWAGDASSYRANRNDATIESQACIEALKIYRYVNAN